MGESADLLMLEFLGWISSRRRTYSEAINAWQSTCPRHTVWEDAIIEGLIQLDGNGHPRDTEVKLTPRGVAMLNGGR